MKKILLSMALIGASMVSLTGCVDNNYDLANIDTESEFKVNDLTIPINLDPIVLDEIIDLKANSKVQIVDGKYVIVVDGNYTSDPVHFSTFTAQAPRLTGETSPISGGQIPTIKKQFIYEANGIDNSIHGIDYLGVKPMQFVITFSAATDFSVSDLRIQMPKGMTATALVGTYDSATGILTVPQVSSTNKQLKVGVEITGIAFNAANSQFKYDAHWMRFTENIDVLSGTIDSNISNLNLSYTLDNITVESFTGDIKYEWKKFRMDDISLTDIPDLINQPGTNLMLENPQLYMSFTNPLEDYGTWGQLGFELVARRNGEPDKTFRPDNNVFTVGKDAKSDVYNYCLAPHMPAELYPGYSNAIFEKFTSLSNALSGNGLPRQIGVNVTDAEYPIQKISNLPLGRNLGKITGKYTFYSPLNLKEGSVIVYKHTEDGWNSAEIDKIRIERLSCTALVTNQLPYNITLEGYPISKDGKQIDNVVIEGAEVPAGAVDYPVTLHATGVITHLDGITFTAYGYAADDKPLQPSQQIILKKLRPTVTGNYIREL